MSQQMPIIISMDDHDDSLKNVDMTTVRARALTDTTSMLQSQESSYDLETDNDDQNQDIHHDCGIVIENVPDYMEPDNDTDDDAMNNSHTADTATNPMHPLEYLARTCSRYPKTHLGVSMGLAVLISILGMIYGEFTKNLAVDLVGWPSRGTLVSLRQTQLRMVQDYRGALRKPDNHDVWIDLTTNVQLGWEIDGNNKLLDEVDSDPASSANTTTKEPTVFRNGDHIVLQRKNLTTLMEECDMELYTRPSFYGRAKLWPTWNVPEANDNPDASALDPDMLEQQCLAEEQTQRVLLANRLCSGCESHDDEDGYNDGSSNYDCLPPMSLVLSARFVVPNGFTMTCSELAQAWAPYQAQVEADWSQCVAHLRTVAQQEGFVGGDYFENRGPCPVTFNPIVVDDRFDQTGRVQYTSSAFVTKRDKDEDSRDVIRTMYDVSEGYGRGGRDGGGGIEGAYDTQYRHFMAYYANDVIFPQLALAMGSAFITTLAMLLHTRSMFLTMFGVTEIALSFPLAYTVYRFIGGFTFFPFLNCIGAFVVFALGADHVFVAVDKWKNRRNQYPLASTEEIAAKALPSAARAMILTTITTSVAFFSSVISPVAPIRLFAIFCGLLIIIDYILDVLIMFPCLCIYDSYRFERNYCISFKAPSGETDGLDDNDSSIVEVAQQGDEAQNPSVDSSSNKNVDHNKGGCDCFGAKSCLHSNNATPTGRPNGETTSHDGLELDMDSSNLIRCMLNGYYEFLHRWRWLILFLSLAAFGACIYFATTLNIPDSTELVTLFNSKVEYEKITQWRLNLLSSALAKETGSSGDVVWGLTPADTGDHSDPYSWTTLELDDTFDPSSQAAQVYLRDFCDTFFDQEFATKKDDDHTCSLHNFDAWLETQSTMPLEDRNATYVEHCSDATGLPMASSSFHACLSSWAHQENSQYIFSWNDTVQIIMIPFQSRVRFNSRNAVIGEEWQRVETWMTEQNQRAPFPVSKAYFGSSDWWFWDTNTNIYQTAYGSAAIALLASALIIFLSSKSLIMTLFSAMSVAFVLVSVVSLLSAAHWTLGTLESICFTILIGLSSDFVIHLSHAYTDVPGDANRHVRTRHALIHLGPSILAAGFTTLMGGAVMMFSVFQFFNLFAVILFFTITQATMGSFVVFLVLTDCFGPSNPTYCVDQCVELISDGCRGQVGGTDKPRGGRAATAAAEPAEYVTECWA